jgi:hypothetical protein
MLPKLLAVVSHKNNKIAIYFGKTELLYGRFCENAGSAFGIGFN